MGIAVQISVRLVVIAKSLRRKFDVAQRAGMFDDPPDTLDQVPIQIRFLSPVMKAQRQMQTRATLNTYAAAQQMVWAHPDIVDNFRGDENIREIAEAEGMRLDGLASLDEVGATREARAEMQAREDAIAEEAQEADNFGKVAPGMAKLAAVPDQEEGAA